jgi:hypothetical protein
MAHLHNPRDVGHRQAILICLLDRLVAVGAKLLSRFLKVCFSPRAFLGKCRQATTSLRRLALRTGDVGIVGCIPANRLA